MRKSKTKNKQNEDLSIVRFIEKIIARTKYLKVRIKHLEINFKVNSYYVGNIKIELNHKAKHSSYNQAMEMVKK